MPLLDELHRQQFTLQATWSVLLEDKVMQHVRVGGAHRITRNSRARSSGTITAVTTRASKTLNLPMFTSTEHR